MESLVNKTLGQFQLVQELGRGGMAVVYKAYQPSLARYVAIKVLPPDLSFDQNFVERFVREARGAALLHHPNIITIHDVAEQDGIHYFVMDYLVGKTLDGVLAETKMPLERMAHIVTQVANALDHAHSQGLIHRDIKPSNIFVEETRGDHAVLMDFGLVRAGEDSKLTQTGMIVGTPDYMSPEQAQGENIDYRTDIYSLGVVLYRMLTGTPPFLRSTPAAVLLAHVIQAPSSIVAANRSVPLAVEAVVLKAMAKDRTQRYQSAGQLARDFQVAITGQMPTGLPLPTFPTAPRIPAAAPPAALTPSGPTAQTPSPVPSVPSGARTARSRPWVWVGLGAVALVILCAGSILAATMLGRLVNGSKTATPRPSPSPGLSQLAAPVLKGPVDGATFTPDETITLTWEAVPGLSAGDTYAVRLDCGAGSSQTVQVKETNYPVPVSLQRSAQPPYRCQWNVTVMAAGNMAISPASSTRQFTWAAPATPTQAAATPTAMRTATPAPTLTSTPTFTPQPATATLTPQPTRTLVYWTATPVACPGNQIWNGKECACPPDTVWVAEAKWCVEKEKGGGGGGRNTPAPP